MSIFNKKTPIVKASTFKTLKEKVFPPVSSYIEPRILPYGSTLGLYGDSKVGKSFLLLNMARALGTGENLYDIKEMPTKECKVLLVEQEVGEISLQDRVSRICHKINPQKLHDNLFYVSRIPEIQLDTNEGQHIIKELLDEVRPNVLILDPIGKLHGYEENSNSQIGDLFKTFEEFKKLNPDDNLSIVYSHHTRKPTGFIPGAPPIDALDPHKARGSSRWFSDPDTIITTERVDTQKNPWEKWKVRMRIILRHGGGPDDFVVKVNWDQFENWNDGDLRVKYFTDLGAVKPLFPQKTPPPPPPTQSPLLFRL